MNEKTTSRPKFKDMSWLEIAHRVAVALGMTVSSSFVPRSNLCFVKFVYRKDGVDYQCGFGGKNCEGIEEAAKCMLVDLFKQSFEVGPHSVVVPVVHFSSKEELEMKLVVAGYGWWFDPEGFCG